MVDKIIYSVRNEELLCLKNLLNLTEWISGDVVFICLLAMLFYDRQKIKMSTWIMSGQASFPLSCLFQTQSWIKAIVYFSVIMCTVAEIFSLCFRRTGIISKISLGKHSKVCEICHRTRYETSKTLTVVTMKPSVDVCDMDQMLSYICSDC